MTRDDIIRMAQEASGVSYPMMDGVKIGMSHEHLKRFADLVAAAEREECAKVCDLIAINACDNRAHDCGVAIRARGQP